MRKKLYLAALIAVILGGLGYWFFDSLGGNNPINIALVNGAPPTLIGLTYEGTPQDEGLGETFEQVEALLRTQPGKKLHTIYEVEPAGKLDTMRVFVGIEGLQVDSLDYRRFTQKAYLVANLEANRWVMPSPVRVQEELKAYAEANGLKISGIYIDKLLSDNRVQVIAPLD